MIATPGLRFERQVLGNQPWGTCRHAGPAHGQWVQQLTVYPPGIISGQRWAVGLDRQAPVIGLGLTVMTFDLLPRWTMPVFVLAPSLIVTFLTRRLTRRIRSQVRCLAIVEDYRTHPSTVSGDAVLFDGCRAALKTLDADAVLLSPVEYERRWGEAYNRLPHSAEPRMASRQ